MSDQINLLKRADSLEISKQLTAFSRVTIYAGQNDDGDNVIYTVGDDTGKVLEIRNEFGSQQMAENILARVSGFQYQPYSAPQTHLDPAAELGDGVSINGVYSGIFARATSFNSLMLADLQAPTEEETDHEFAVETSRSDRQYSRFVAATKASLKITSQQITAEVERATSAESMLSAALTVQAGQIAAKVSKTGGSASSFGWELTDSMWRLISGSKEVLKATSAGIEVSGKITATSGYIGNGSSGFTISASAIYNNIPIFGGTQTQGVYIGTNGIQLGQKFKVDSQGNLTASSGTFTGNVYANKISVGGNAGYISGSQIGSATIGGSNIKQKTITGGGSGNIALSTIASGNTNFSSTLNQVGTNASNIEAHSRYFIGAAIASRMSVSDFTAGTAYLGNNYGGDVYYKGSRLTRVAIYDASGNYRDVLGF